MQEGDKQTLLEAFKFHGHRCWASAAGVRVGLAALRKLGVNRASGSGELTSVAYLRVVGDRHVCIPCSGYGE